MIQVELEKIYNPEYIESLVSKAKKQLKQKQARYLRYTRENKKDIDVAIEYYIVNIASGYFGGIAPDINIKQEQNEKKKKLIKKLFGIDIGQNADSEEFQLLVDYLRESNDDSTVFYQMSKDYFLTGSCYALQFEDEDNNLKYTRIDALKTVGLYDYSTPIEDVGIIRFNQYGNTEEVEIITSKEVLVYTSQNNASYALNGEKSYVREVPWLLNPAICIENPDNICIFSTVENLIDALETIIANNKDTFDQNADAKLIAIGYAPQNDMIIEDDDGDPTVNPARIAEDNAVLNAKMLYVDGDKENRGDFKWLLKELNDTASENHKKTLIDLIFMIACVPNVTDIGFSKADNSSALEKKFFPLEQIVIEFEKLFKKEYLELFENFTHRINFSKNTNFNYREIDIVFKRNLPSNASEIVETWLKLKGLVSDETILSNLPFPIDVETEKARINEQDEFDINNFYLKADEDVEKDKQGITEISKEVQE